MPIAAATSAGANDESERWASTKWIILDRRSGVRPFHLSPRPRHAASVSKYKSRAGLSSLWFPTASSYSSCDSRAKAAPDGLPLGILQAIGISQVCSLASIIQRGTRKYNRTHSVPQLDDQGRPESITVLSPPCSNTSAPFCAYRRKPCSWVITMQDLFSAEAASTGHFQNESGVDENRVSFKAPISRISIDP